MKGSASNESWRLIMTIVMADVIKLSNPLSFFLSLAYLGRINISILR